MHGFGVKALLVFWTAAAISGGSCWVKLQAGPAQASPREGLSACRDSASCRVVSLARNMKPGSRAGVWGHSISLLGYVLKARVISSGITESWYQAKGCRMPRVAKRGTSGQVLVGSQSTDADQVEEGGESEAFKDVKCFHFGVNKKKVGNFLKEFYLEVIGYY